FNVKKIISFEASEINFSKLKKNLELNKKRFFQSNILIENLALGKEKEKKIFKQFIETSSSTFSDININSKYFKKKFQLLNKKKRDGFFEEKQIQLVPLCEYLENKNIDKIDVLKIDTEGFEFEILQGLKKQIKIIDIIFFEHHYDDMINKSYTYSDIHNLLKKNNFEKIFKSKMPFRKTFEYIYRNKVNI
ncbi:FkbM family methyltransferase, partial [Candidatus Pelagibacter sp.]|nr:FkbM family methyltransferase [Candidatus Pelagibacter sp.]